LHLRFSVRMLPEQAALRAVYSGRLLFYFCMDGVARSAGASAQRVVRMANDALPMWQAVVGRFMFSRFGGHFSKFHRSMAHAKARRAWCRIRFIDRAITRYAMQTIVDGLPFWSSHVPRKME
jgi:hypothetical protein